MNAVVEQSTKPEKSAYERLPRRCRRFVDEWVGGKNAVESIKAAGYKGLFPHQAAAKFRRRSEIAAAIAERERYAASEAGARHVTVVRELQRIATCDPRKLVNGEGVLLQLHELPDDIAACISSVEVEDISTNGETGTRYKYKFWDKNKALDKLGQYLKLWDAKGPTVNVDARSVTVNAVGGAEALSGAVRLLEQVRSIATVATATAGDPNGSVLPAAVRDESAGRGASVDAGADSGSPGAT